MAAAREVKPVALCSRPSTWMFWVRGPQLLSGLSLITTLSVSALAPSFTVSVLG